MVHEGPCKRCADQNNSGRFVPLQEKREMADRWRDQPSPLHALASGLLDHPLDVINGVVEGQGCASCEAFGLVAINVLQAVDEAGLDLLVLIVGRLLRFRSPTLLALWRLGWRKQSSCALTLTDNPLAE